MYVVENWSKPTCSPGGCLEARMSCQRGAPQLLLVLRRLFKAPKGLKIQFLPSVLPYVLEFGMRPQELAGSDEIIYNFVSSLQIKKANSIWIRHFLLKRKYSKAVTDIKINKLLISQLCQSLCFARGNDLTLPFISEGIGDFQSFSKSTVMTIKLGMVLLSRTQ